MRSFFLPFVLVLLLIGAGLLYPSWKNLESMKTDLAKLSQDLEKKTKDLKLLDEQIQNEERALKNLVKSVPQYLDQAEIVRDITQITKKHSFSFESLQFSKGIQSRSNTPELVIQFGAQGAAEKITTFLESFEQNDPFIGLKNLQVSIDKNSDGNPKANLGLSLYTLSLR